MTTRNPFAMAIRHRDIIVALVRQTLRERVAGSAFGAVFLAIYPLIFLSVYSFVFIEVLKVRAADLSPETYTLAIFCGLVPFLAFAEALSAGTGSIVSNAMLVRNLMFPYEILPMKDVLASHTAIGFGYFMVVCAAIWDRGFHLSQLVYPFVIMLQILFTVGLVWMFSTANVFFRDIQKLLPILMLFLMMVSPIAYMRDMVPSGLSAVAEFNPLGRFIFVYRDILLNGVVPVQDLVILSVVSLLVFGIGYAVIRRLRPLVFDFV